MTSALVTGSTGFVGSFLVEELLDHGRDVSCVIRSSSDLRWLKEKPVDFVNWDLVNGSPPLDQLSGVEEVYHVAGLVSTRDVNKFYRVNAETVPPLIDTLFRADAPLRRFVQISSLAAAGPAYDRTPRNESEPCNPVSHYGKSKREGEVNLKNSIGDVPYTIIRPPVVVGPRDEMILDMVEMVTNRFVPRFGRNKRYSFVYVRDLVRGIRQAAEAPEARNNTYFLSHADSVSWTTFIESIGEELGIDPVLVPLPDRFASVLATVSEYLSDVPGMSESFNVDKARELQQPSWLCSPEKAERELGFHAQYDFQDTVRETVGWYRNSGWLPS